MPFPVHESDLLTTVCFGTGSLSGRPVQKRHLSDLRGYFADEAAYEAALKQEDTLLYTVSSVEPAHGEGQMHYGLGILQPGKIGDEYFLTKGHFHTWREAAEVYVGLRGQGYMLLEHEPTGASTLVSLGEGEIVYVPGYTAHRTINTGSNPLAYLGIYPWNAGHDYGAIAERNFLKILVDQEGHPTLCDRKDYPVTHIA